jgi:hypothetical protein
VGDPQLRRQRRQTPQQTQHSPTDGIPAYTDAAFSEWMRGKKTYANDPAHDPIKRTLQLQQLQAGMVRGNRAWSFADNEERSSFC